MAYTKDDKALVERGYALTADASIESADTETALESAQFRLDRKLHDLRSAKMLFVRNFLNP